MAGVFGKSVKSATQGRANQSALGFGICGFSGPLFGKPVFPRLCSVGPIPSLNAPVGSSGSRRATPLFLCQATRDRIFCGIDQSLGAWEKPP
jgi:hypothetical protein